MMGSKWALSWAEVPKSSFSPWLRSSASKAPTVLLGVLQARTKAPTEVTVAVLLSAS